VSVIAEESSIADQPTVFRIAQSTARSSSGQMKPSRPTSKGSTAPGGGRGQDDALVSGEPPADDRHSPHAQSRGQGASRCATRPVDPDSTADRPAPAYSCGMKRRLDLATTLSRPRLTFSTIRPPTYPTERPRKKSAAAMAAVEDG
jgi:hypothetical protein